MTNTDDYRETRITVANGSVYARDYPGAGPTFVLMHGFPDNLHIYDDLIPHLVAGGRRVVAFDFLGFGSSDKPNGGFSFAQQLADLEAVVDKLDLGSIIPVAHDSSGAAAINYTLAHRDRVASLCLLNSVYDDAFPTQWPELVELFSTPSLSALAMAVAQSPEQFGWVLLWQQRQFRDALPEPIACALRIGHRASDRPKLHAVAERRPGLRAPHGPVSCRTLPQHRAPA